MLVTDDINSQKQHVGILLTKILCTLMLLVAIRCCVTKSATRASKLLGKLPSPPGWLPVIGHAHLIGSLPHISLRDLATKYGSNLMLLHLGAVPTLVVSSSRAAQAILRTHDDVFASRPYSVVCDILFYGPSDIAFAPYGEYWRQVKKMTTMHLLSAKKVRSYRFARQQEVQHVMARIAGAAMAHTTVDLSELLNYFSNDMICHVMCGNLFRQQGHNHLFRQLVEANSVLISGFNLESYFPRMARVAAIGRLLYAKAHHINNRWNQLLDKLINDRTSNNNGDEEESSDFIDTLLSLKHEYNFTIDNIKAILVDMFEAGTDTSSIVMEYAMVELMQKPQLMAKLQTEVRSMVPKGEEMVSEEHIVGRMPFLEAVVKETMRLHPAAPLLVPHLSMEDCDIEGYTIPSGTRVVVNAWALARDPIYWENADEFVPERFIGATITADYKGNDLHFLPFGTGRRICPGINFAMANVYVMLANLVYRFDWELPADKADVGIDNKETFGITLHRKEKLLLLPRY
ncbi:hypothetical protein GUJ93_ZPchr0010g9688 [Zizania palustris]|uniref:Cytochrome P450 n=1 Tax=Zizania palustris TaxID=103762 RepID=A0A8J6BPD7_ZIZPA|nr:hypothetical protein GUJ93_ZPchr0010g9688 [Zizania palustris]